MVAKIMKSSGSMKSPLDYNEHKVEEGNAQVVAMMNMDDSLDPLHDTFDRYERGNIRTKDVSFHMSINPGPGENLSDEQIKAFVGDLMKGLGYGDQPVVIFRHNDIDREHFHVVSIRVDGDGKKVKDFLENKNCLNLLNELSEKYGFSVGNPEAEVKDIKDVPAMEPVDPSCFHPERGNAVLQLDAIASECCTYRMTSPGQFAMVMRNHGVDVKEGRDGKYLLKGLDGKGKPCMKPVSSRKLSFDLPMAVKGRISECLKSGKVPVEALHRASSAVAVSLVNSRSPKEFTEMLARVGIDWESFHDKDGKLTGVMFADNETRCVFNVSELKGVGLKTFEKMEDNGWDGKAALEDAAREPSVSQQVMQGLSFLEALFSSMSSGGSHEHEMKDTPRRNKGRRR